MITQSLRVGFVLAVAGVAILASVHEIIGQEKKAPPPKIKAKEPPKPMAYQLVPGEFPPAGTAKVIGGELIKIDPINRRGVLRIDRTDDLTKPMWDRPQPFAMLPYGAIQYRGSPAELRDIPIGTHLVVEFYEGPKIDQYATDYEGVPPRASPYLSFSRVLRLEDDFSRDARLGRKWKIESIDVDGGFLMAVASSADAKPSKFFVGPDSRLYQGRSFASLTDIKPGQQVLMNITEATLFGPGRITDLWLDEESRTLASAQQLAIHRRHAKIHGIPGWITAVDDKAGLVTVTLFGNCDPKLLEEFLPADLLTAAVAEETLRTYDQINDVKRGPGTCKKVEADRFGHGGRQLTFRPGDLLEGFRPQRIVRVWPSAWGIRDLPREEKLFE